MRVIIFIAVFLLSLTSGYAQSQDTIKIKEFENILLESTKKSIVKQLGLDPNKSNYSSRNVKGLYEIYVESRQILGFYYVLNSEPWKKADRINRMSYVASIPSTSNQDMMETMASIMKVDPRGYIIFSSNVKSSVEEEGTSSILNLDDGEQIIISYKVGTYSFTFRADGYTTQNKVIKVTAWDTHECFVTFPEN